MDNKAHYTKWTVKFRIVHSRNNRSEQKNLYGVFRNIMRNLKKEEDGLAEFVLTTNDDDDAYKNELRWKISKQI